MIKIFFYHFSFISQAENKFSKPIMGIDLHDMPQNGPVTDLNHGFGFKLGLFPEPGSKTSAEDYYWDIRIHYSFLSLTISYRMTESRGQKADDRDQRTESRGQKAEDRDQRTESRGLM